MTGQDHPRELGAGNFVARIANLAFLFSNQGRLEEAKRLLAQVMETRKTLVLVVGNPATCLSQTVCAVNNASWQRGMDTGVGDRKWEVKSKAITRISAVVLHFSHGAPLPI